MVLRNNGLYSRELIGLFGKVKFKRTALKPADPESAKRLMELDSLKSIYPLDQFIGIDKLPFKITCEMMCEIAKEAVQERCYERAAQRIREHHHIDISSVQVEKVTDFVGACVLEEQRDIASYTKHSSMSAKVDERFRRKRENDILYLEIDGAYVHLRDKDGHDAWTESKHAIAFHSRDIVFDKDNGEEIHKIKSREFIGYIGTVDEFKYHFLALAKRHQCDKCTEVVVISDGAPWIHNMVDELLSKYTHIIDLFHLKQTVGKFVTAFVPGKKGEALADEVNNLIENGEIDKALEKLEKYKDKPLPKGTPNAYTYIVNNRDQMQYPFYRKMGYFVGSGAIESANKQLMQNRLKLQGMRWTTEGAQRMLALKSKFESKKWNDVVRIVREKVFGSDYEYIYSVKLHNPLTLHL